MTGAIDGARSNPDDRLVRPAGGHHAVSRRDFLDRKRAMVGFDPCALGEARHGLNRVAVNDPKRSRADAGAEDDAVDAAGAGARAEECARHPVEAARLR